MTALRRWGTAKALHGACAALVGSFALLHLANHLAALAGVEAHIAVMRAARSVYRQPLVEALLLGAFAFQIVSGLRLVVRTWHRPGLVARVQRFSGLCLAGFLAIHVSAVLLGRGAWQQDTNFYFAAAGLHVPPWAALFVPYYFGGVFSLFVHLGCALHHRAHRAALWAMASGGAALGAVIVLCLAGVLIPVEVPAAYRAKYLFGSPGS